MKLKGRVALVTGAGSGMGREMALLFSREGASIGVNDCEVARAESVVSEINGQGGRSLALQADVSNSEQVKKMCATLLAEFGSIDILVNNAGIGNFDPRVRENIAKANSLRLAGKVPDTSLGGTRYITDEEWQRMLAIHLFGTFCCTREVLQTMESRRFGKIINISSFLGIVGAPFAPHYAAAKGGIIAFTKSVALDVIGSGINVNCIAPGYIDTPLARKERKGLGPSQPIPTVSGLPTPLRIPMGRYGTTGEIASLALFLASDDSSYVVGQVISANGGVLV